MPNLTEQQWAVLMSRLDELIEGLAGKNWDALKSHERAALSLAGLTQDEWDRSGVEVRKSSLQQAPWNPITEKGVDALVDGLAHEVWSGLTDEEQAALSLKDEKQWTPLTQEARRAIVEFVLLSDALAVPREGEALAEHTRWTLPQPDNKALADRP